MPTCLYDWFFLCIFYTPFFSISPSPHSSGRLMLSECISQALLDSKFAMPFASVDFLSAVIPTGPPFWLVFTDWLSMITALRVDSRPRCLLKRSHKHVWSCSHTPALRQMRKELQTVDQGGISWGSILHWQPLFKIYQMVLITSHILTGFPGPFTQSLQERHSTR
jgi:hypothetical protein